MELQKLYSYLRQAVDDYAMIEDGDRIAVGVSGGKDSLTLLYGLSGLRGFYPKKYDITAVTVDLGYEGFDCSVIAELCEKLGVEYSVVHTQINGMVSEGGCSLCARLRKGAFNNRVRELGCNKFAYAHNMDDAIETMLLSLIYEGRFSSFEPVTEYEDSGITLIRPMIYVPKERVYGFCRKMGLEPVKNPCPYEKRTERTYVRELLAGMEHHAPGTKKRMFNAIQNGTIEKWKPGML